MLEQNTIKKGQIDEQLKLSNKFETKNNYKKYEVKLIINIMVYIIETKNHMLCFYYLVLWKGYLKEKCTWKPLVIVMHLQKLINTLYKEHPEKLTATSRLLNFVLPITRTIVLK